MKKCSEYLSHIIGGVILFSIIGACSSKALSHDGNDAETVAVDTIADDSVDVKEVVMLSEIGACSSKALSHDGNDTETVAVDMIADDNVDVKEIVMLSEQDIHSQRDFIKAFYQGFVANDDKMSFVEAYITPKAMQYLQDEYEKEYDCEYGVCLAVWLFAYEPGSAPGAFLSHHIEEVTENDFRVVTKYELTDYVALVTVIEDGDTYKIDHVKKG